MSLGFLTAIAWELSRAAFTDLPRKEIKSRANGYCEHCHEYVGKDQIIAAHFIHGRTPKLNKASNGEGKCLRCEAEYHLQNSGYPKAIGLCTRDNDRSVYGQVMQLNESQREELIQNNYDLWLNVLKRLHKV